MEGALDQTDDQAARPARPWFGVLLGVALLAAGTGAWMLGKPPATTKAGVLGRNLPVNAGATDRRDITANNSPSLARNPVDPANLVVANRIDRPSYSCALRASFNGGASWEEVTVPFPAGEEDPPRCFAPDVAYASDGTLHMSFVTLKGNGNVPNALWTVSSKDGGRTLSRPVKASGPLAFQVQLTADPSLADRLYLTWLQAEATGLLLFPNTGNPIVTSTSIDGGATWSAPARVTPSSRLRAVAPSPSLGPNGELYVLYLDLLDDRLDYGGAHEGRGGDPYDGPWALVLARSVDHGTTWEETLVDGEIRPTERFIVFLPPTPTLAVDPTSGRIYAGFTDGRKGDPDVDVWVSTDGGKTFGPPVRVNDTPERDGTSQYLPRLDVAPNGRVDVVYFDRRGDLNNVMNEVSLQSSFDGGRTFRARVRVSDQAFDSRVGPGSERKLPDLGSRLALISTARRALAVWPDTRAGTEITSKQDLASAVVDVPPPATSSRGWLRVVGAVAFLLGLVSLVLALRPKHKVTGGIVLDPSVARPPKEPKRRRSQPEPDPFPPLGSPIPPAGPAHPLGSPAPMPPLAPVASPIQPPPVDAPPPPPPPAVPPGPPPAPGGRPPSPPGMGTRSSAPPRSPRPPVAPAEAAPVAPVLRPGGSPISPVSPPAETEADVSIRPAPAEPVADVTPRPETPAPASPPQPRPQDVMPDPAPAPGPGPDQGPEAVTQEAPATPEPSPWTVAPSGGGEAEAPPTPASPGIQPPPDRGVPPHEAAAAPAPPSPGGGSGWPPAPAPPPPPPPVPPAPVPVPDQRRQEVGNEAPADREVAQAPIPADPGDGTGPEGQQRQEPKGSDPA